MFFYSFLTSAGRGATLCTALHYSVIQKGQVMRIVSLLPSNTEMMWNVGLGEPLLDLGQECDYPPSVTGIPVIIYSLLCSSSSAEIDAKVGIHVRSKATHYKLYKYGFAALQLDRVVTQTYYGLCTIFMMVVQDMLDHIQQLAKLAALLQVLFQYSKTPNKRDKTSQAVEDIVRCSSSTAVLLEKLSTLNERVQTRPKGTPAFLVWMKLAYDLTGWIARCVVMVAQTAGFGSMKQPSLLRLWGKSRAFAPEALLIRSIGFLLAQTLPEAQETLASRIGWQQLPTVGSQQLDTIDKNYYFRHSSPALSIARS